MTPVIRLRVSDDIGGPEAFTSVVVHDRGMYIDEFHETSVSDRSEDVQQIEVCGVACMLRVINDRGGPDAFTSNVVHANGDTKASRLLQKPHMLSAAG